MPDPTPVQSITTAPVALRDEQAVRTRNYVVMMTIRAVCFLLAVFVPGPLRWVAVVGAIVLPYVAVVVANAVSPRVYDQNASVVATPPTRHLGHRV